MASTILSSWDTYGDHPEFTLEPRISYDVFIDGEPVRKVSHLEIHTYDWKNYLLWFQSTSSEPYYIWTQALHSGNVGMNVLLGEIERIDGSNIHVTDRNLCDELKKTIDDRVNRVLYDYTPWHTFSGR